VAASLTVKEDLVRTSITVMYNATLRPE